MIVPDVDGRAPESCDITMDEIAFVLRGSVSLEGVSDAQLRERFRLWHAGRFERDE